ncbi:MAG TPA: MFS transporter [Candidatus Limnocylindrales bacterium]|nr:MFS transporter [Candidatus Limnocylindrales bacterium]
MPRSSVSRPAAAGILGCAAFLLIGWTGLLVPSLIRSIKETFDQSDAGIGLVYLLYASAYAAGSLGGGLATERLGRRTVLALAAAVHGIGLLLLGLGPTWIIFMTAALPMGLGAGGIDGGVNGLFLDLFRSGRGRALNLLHLFFSLGALTAPLAVGFLVEGGVAWQPILIGTALMVIPVAVLFGVVEMPGGRHDRRGRPSERGVAAGGARTRFAAPIILLGVAISCYVASEVGVSSWLVRFLEPAPLAQATTALSLFWAGLAVGRLVSSQVADRFDHLAFATVSAVGIAVALIGAIFVPSLPISIALFAITGFASGPVFPMIVAIGGERYPDRSAAVSGFLTGSAVVGSVIYPPVMGFLSVTVGLTVAMVGNVILALASAGALLLVGRSRRGDNVPA